MGPIDKIQLVRKQQSILIVLQAKYIHVNYEKMTSTKLCIPHHQHQKIFTRTLPLMHLIIKPVIFKRRSINSKRQPEGSILFYGLNLSN
jgi:hypothetical protein